MTDNLVRLYGQAVAADHIAGTEWYPRARAIVGEWATYYGYTHDTVACVIAAISPRCSWERNLVIANDVLSERPPSIGALRANVDKAIALRNEDTNDAYFGPDGEQPTSDAISTRMLRRFPGGPKVNCFAHNLAGHDDVVTVDTHAVQAALNDPIAVYGIGWTPYREFARAYVTAASAVGVPPATFQAILWCAWKRLYPAADKRALIRKANQS